MKEVKTTYSVELGPGVLFRTMYQNDRYWTEWHEHLRNTEVSTTEWVPLEADGSSVGSKGIQRTFTMNTPLEIPAFVRKAMGTDVVPVSEKSTVTWPDGQDGPDKGYTLFSELVVNLPIGDRGLQTMHFTVTPTKGGRASRLDFKQTCVALGVSFMLKGTMESSATSAVNKVNLKQWKFVVEYVARNGSGEEEEEEQPSVAGSPSSGAVAASGGAGPAVDAATEALDEILCRRTNLDDLAGGEGRGSTASSSGGRERASSSSSGSGQPSSDLNHSAPAHHKPHSCFTPSMASHATAAVVLAGVVHLCVIAETNIIVILDAPAFILLVLLCLLLALYVGFLLAMQIGYVLPHDMARMRKERDGLQKFLKEAAGLSRRLQTSTVRGVLGSGEAAKNRKVNKNKKAAGKGGAVADGNAGNAGRVACAEEAEGVEGGEEQDGEAAIALQHFSDHMMSIRQNLEGIGAECDQLPVEAFSLVAGSGSSGGSLLDLVGLQPGQSNSAKAADSVPLLLSDTVKVMAHLLRSNADLRMCVNDMQEVLTRQPMAKNVHLEQRMAGTAHTSRIAGSGLKDHIQRTRDMKRCLEEAALPVVTLLSMVSRELGAPPAPPPPPTTAPSGGGGIFVGMKKRLSRGGADPGASQSQSSLETDQTKAGAKGLSGLTIAVNAPGTEDPQLDELRDAAASASNPSAVAQALSAARSSPVFGLPSGQTQPSGSPAGSSSTPTAAAAAAAASGEEALPDIPDMSISSLLGYDEADSTADGGTVPSRGRSGRSGEQVRQQHTAMWDRLHAVQVGLKDMLFALGMHLDALSDKLELVESSYANVRSVRNSPEDVAVKERFGLPPDDWLIESYSCVNAYHLHGFLHITPSAVCFDTHLLQRGGVHKVVVSMDKIVSLDRPKNFVGMKNSLQIVTDDGQKLFFTSFLACADAYKDIFSQASRFGKMQMPAESK